MKIQINNWLVQKNIISYLFKTYGCGSLPLTQRFPLVNLSSFIASLLRGFRGIHKIKQAKSPQFDDPTTIELYSFEACPYSRLVREVLCELELPYLLHNVGKKSLNRKQFIGISGKMMVPYLIDKSNKEMTGMFESSQIINYLHQTYLN